MTDLVNSDPASGPGHIEQSLQRSQTGNDVFHLAPRVRRAEEFHADPWQKKRHHTQGNIRKPSRQSAAFTQVSHQVSDAAGQS